MEALFVKNPQLDDSYREYIIYGVGTDAVLMFTMLMQNGIKVKCFCDPKGELLDIRIMNKPVISLEELEKYKEGIYLVYSGTNHNEAEKLEKDGYNVLFDYNLASYRGNSILV